MFKFVLRAETIQLTFSKLTYTLVNETVFTFSVYNTKDLSRAVYEGQSDSVTELRSSSLFGVPGWLSGARLPRIGRPGQLCPRQAWLAAPLRLGAAPRAG